MNIAADNFLEQGTRAFSQQPYNRAIIVRFV